MNAARRAAQLSEASLLDRRHFLVLTAADGVQDDAGTAARSALEAVGLRPAVPRRVATTAIEIGFEGAPPDRSAQAALLPGAPIDVNVVPAERRTKRLLVADMDSTIIGVECIDELADFAGVKAEVATITERAMLGELDFEGALDARVALLAGLPETALAETYAERVRLNPGARTLVRTMAALGAKTALVSGGFDYFTMRVAEQAGFAVQQANRLEIADGRLTGKVARPILGRDAKRDALQRLAAGAGVTPDDAVAIGDGANDLAMVREAGLGVAYRAKPALAAEADARLQFSDLSAVLALQGIPQNAWRV